MADSTSVELVLVRHGIAVERISGRDNPDRALTDRGRARTRAVLEALVQRGVCMDHLISSPYRRALETAQMAREVGFAPTLAIDGRLRPNSESLPDLMEELAGRVALVGHEPDLSAMACQLLGMAPGQLVLKKAGVLHLHRSDGQWRLRALLRPGLLLDTSA